MAYAVLCSSGTDRRLTSFISITLTDFTSFCLFYRGFQYARCKYSLSAEYIFHLRIPAIGFSRPEDNYGYYFTVLESPVHNPPYHYKGILYRRESVNSVAQNSVNII
jgi:hypothetical protein